MAEPWEQEYDKFERPGYGSHEYEVEINAVAHGNKPAHYGFYSREETLVVLDSAREMGLLVQKGPSKYDYVVTLNSRKGRDIAAKIMGLAKRIREEPDAIDDPQIHYEFSRLLGYEEDLAKKMVAIAGPEELEKRRHYKMMLQNALSSGRELPPGIRAAALKMFPDLDKVGRYKGEE